MSPVPLEPTTHPVAKVLISENKSVLSKPYYSPVCFGFGFGFNTLINGEVGNPVSKMSHIQVFYELAPTSSVLGGLSWALLIHANYSAPSQCYFFPLSQTQYAPGWIMLGFNPVISLVASRGSGQTVEESTCRHTGKDSNSVPCMRKHQLPRGRGVLPLQL